MCYSGTCPNENYHTGECRGGKNLSCAQENEDDDILLPEEQDTDDE